MNSERLNNPGMMRRTFLAGCLVIGIVATTAMAADNCLANQHDGTADDKVSVEVEIDKSEVLVAEPFQMKITATSPQGVVVKFPELNNRLGDFEVLNVNDFSDIPSGTHRKWIRKVDLESLVAGGLEIPAIEVSYVDRRGATPITGLETCPPRSMTVRSTLEGTEDPAQFRDIKSVIFLPEPEQRNNNWLVWSAAAAGFIFVFASALAVVRRKRILSPRQRALKSLQDLKTSLAESDQDIEHVYIQMVNILRLFVLEQFAISAPRLTTHEFLEAMQREERLSNGFRDKLSELLHLADMVKFAGLLPSSGGLDDVVDHATQLVENAAEQNSAKAISEASSEEDK